MKKLGWLLFLISVCIVTGCRSTMLSDGQLVSGQTAKIIVGFTNSNNMNLAEMQRADAFVKYAKSDPEIEVSLLDAQNNINKQLDQIDEFIARKVNVIVLQALDSREIAPGVKKANAAGIPVIALGSQVSDSAVTFIGVPNYDAGKMQGDFMRERLPLHALIVYLQGTRGLYHAEERWQGFKTALLDKRPDIRVLDSLSGNYDRAEGLKLMECWNSIFGQVDAVIAANDQMALGAIEVLKAANRLRGVLVSGVDGQKEALQAIQAGEMSQTIFQDTDGMGKACFEVIQSIKKGETPPKEIMVPFKPVTKDNINEYVK